MHTLKANPNEVCFTHTQLDGTVQFALGRPAQSTILRTDAATITPTTNHNLQTTHRTVETVSTPGPPRSVTHPRLLIQALQYILQFSPAHPAVLSSKNSQTSSGQGELHWKT